MLISSIDTLANTCHTAKRSRGLNGYGQRCLCFLKIALIFFDRKRLEQSKGFDLAFQVAFTLYAASSVHYSRLKSGADPGFLKGGAYY